MSRKAEVAAPGTVVPWPEDWGQRFTLFVDVEEEFDWTAPFSREARATTTVPALLPFAEEFAARGVGVTYLCDYPVAADPAAVAVLRRIVALAGAEVGTQLHPWVNPPFDEIVSVRNSYAGNLPETLEAAKLAALTEAITAATGVRPRAYRAGRYGFGPNTARLLAGSGYRLDTSMRAGFDYRDDGGPDFRQVDPAATWLDGGLVELPLTTVFTGRARQFGAPLYHAVDRVPHARGLLARSRLVSRVPLTPEGVPVAEALEAIRTAAGEGLRVLNFSFHSPSLVPGHTPYVRDAGDLARFRAWWDTVLACLDRLGIRPASLADVLDACDRTRASATAG